MANGIQVRYGGAAGWERRLAVLGFVLALVAYAVGAWNSPLADPERRAAIGLLTHHAGSGKLDEQAERRLADTYWSRNADVEADSYFGRRGLLGVWGAREHFKRHGRREGRVWPKGDARDQR